MVYMWFQMSHQDFDTSMVYAITPETPFTPTANVQYKSNVYKIGSILRKTESRHVEYKTGGGRYIYQILPSHVRMYGSAFLNTSGGVLCVGVNDEGVVCGVRIQTHEKHHIRRLIVDELKKFTPSVDEKFYEIQYLECNRKDIYVLEISFRAGDPFDIYSDGENKMYYKRDGSIEGPLWPVKIKEIVISKHEKFLQVKRSKED